MPDSAQQIAADCGLGALDAAQLFRALSQAVAAGKIGTPVALRVHARLGDSTHDVIDACARLFEGADSLFPANGGRLFAQMTEGCDQCSLLVTCASGGTVSVTVSRVPGCAAKLQLLCIGNHGVARLEGEEGWQIAPAANTPKAARWRHLIEQSARQQTAVNIES